MQNHGGACNELAYCYRYGRGVVADQQQAFELYQKAAQLGVAAAQYEVGTCTPPSVSVAPRGLTQPDHWRGEIIPANHATAVKWWKEAVAKGHLAAMVLQSVRAVSETLQVDLAFCYRQGDGVEQNYKEALELYRKAADKGNSHGQHGLATLYYHGLGSEKKVSEAIKWWRKAAEQGLAAAQVDLAFTLRQSGNFVEALQWYKKAAEANNSGGQHGYGYEAL